MRRPYIHSLWDQGITLGHLLYVILQFCVSPSSAGVCWMSITSHSDLCRSPIHYNMTQEDCCSINSIVNVSWTPHEHVTGSDLFYWQVLAGGAPKCHRCHKTCEHVECEPNKRCRMRGGVPQCVCHPNCDKKLKSLGPFCGTDVRRYRNYCALQRQNCRTLQQTDIAYLGNCKRSCRNVQCFKGRHCLEDQNGLPHCVSCHVECPFVTPDNYLCGEDGITYTNACELKAAICRNGKSIRVAYKGKCKVNATCTNIRCGSKMKCLTETQSGRPVCTDCVHMCDSTIQVPVCGTDKNTYPNYCEMQRQSCHSGIVIRTKRYGPCRARKVKSNKRTKARRKIQQRKKKRKEKLRARKLRRKSHKLKGRIRKSKLANYVIDKKDINDGQPDSVPYSGVKADTNASRQ